MTEKCENMKSMEEKKISDTSEKVWIVIPLYHEETVVRSVIEEIRKSGFGNIIIVDDGSHDNTFNEAKKTGVVTLRHRINRGKGAATRTGIEAAKVLGADIVITMDGDGQHNPEDIRALIQPIQSKKVDVALGTRLTDTRGMPFYKIIGNYIGNFFTWYFYGLWVSDSQSGFRAYSRHAVDVIDTRTDRYEYDSEVIREIRMHRLKFKEIPITVRYTHYSEHKRYRQNFLNGLKTIYSMIFRIIH